VIGVLAAHHDPDEKLKYLDDELTGEAVREQARKPLCIRPSRMKEMEVKP
jgi:hypothetical protein